MTKKERKHLRDLDRKIGVHIGLHESMALRYGKDFIKKMEKYRQRKAVKNVGDV